MLWKFLQEGKLEKTCVVSALRAHIYAVLVLKHQGHDYKDEPINQIRAETYFSKESCAQPKDSRTGTKKIKAAMEQNMRGKCPASMFALCPLEPYHKILML